VFCMQGANRRAKGFLPLLFLAIFKFGASSKQI